PGLFLIDDWIQSLETGEKKGKRMMTYFLIFYSFIIVGLNMKYLSVAARQLQTFNKEFNAIDSDLRIVPSIFLSMYQGLDYFQIPIVFLNNPESVKKFLLPNREKIKQYKSVCFYTAHKNL